MDKSTSESLSAPADPQILEIYKLTVEMADRVSQRRATANAFFLSVNTALVTLAGLLPQMSTHTALAFICVAGILVSSCWWQLLRGYRTLNSAKFEVINDIERKYLPVQPFCNEWRLLGHGKEGLSRATRLRVRFRQLGTIERVIPIVFAIVYLALIFWPR